MTELSVIKLVQLEKVIQNQHCAKSVRIRCYSGPHFPAFGLNTERCGVSLRIQSECREMRTRITPNTDTFLLSAKKHFKKSYILKIRA